MKKLIAGALLFAAVMDSEALSLAILCVLLFCAVAGLCKAAGERY